MARKLHTPTIIATFQSKTDVRIDALVTEHRYFLCLVPC